MIAARQSLFDQAGASPIGNAAQWLSGTLLGSVAVTLCILAIALVGLLMLGGRLPIKHGLRTIIGCFVIFGAPVIAGALTLTGKEIAGPSSLPILAAEREDLRDDLPQSNYDPYAGASLRRD